MLRELADHTEQVTANTAEARLLRNTLVQLLAERPQQRAAPPPCRPFPNARSWWRRPRPLALRCPQRARACIGQVVALCDQVEAEVDRAQELGQRLLEDGRARRGTI